MTNDKIVHIGIKNDTICVVCGRDVPEGTMICSICQKEILNK